MKKPTQTINGKAFEYALLIEFSNRLKGYTSVSIIENTPFTTAQNCFTSFNEKEKSKFLLTASFAVNFLMDIEPKLSNAVNKEDILQLELASDREGQKGDVRDVLIIRPIQKWEIGVSAKNNHRAVKHSRLSKEIDFGEKWLGFPCSLTYFDEIKPVFDLLEKLRDESKSTQKWNSLGNYHQSVYLPILNAFKTELLRLEKNYSGIIAEKLVQYLIGKYDFYKVIKGNNKVEIQAYNLNGTLNLPFRNIKPKAKVQKLKLPNRLIEVALQENSSTTLLVTLNEGWQISFRIHNASSRIEPSLKFDINLVSAPHTLFSNQLFF
jgi:hypothetical protein